MKTRRTLSLILILAMILGVFPAMSSQAKSKAASIYSDCKKITLRYSDRYDNKLASFATIGFESCIENSKKNATYSIVIKNKKIAKAVKNTWSEDTDPTVIYATGTGSTTATVYEKDKNSKKKKAIGTIKIKVKKATMADAAEQSMYTANNMKYNAWLKLNLRESDKYFDLDSYLFNNVLNDKKVGISFKKSEYTLTCKESEYGDQSVASVSENGLVTGHKAGDTFFEYCITFKDGSQSDNSMSVKVTDSVLKKEGKYNINNIRNQIVGLNTPVELSDGTKTPLINFDNAATTPSFKPVQDEVNEKLDMYGSIGRGFSQKSNYSTDIYNDTRDKVLEFVGADPEKYTCFYVNNTTDGLNKLASALIEKKSEIVLTTRIEHHANDLSWRERCKVIYAEVDDNGRIIYDDIEKLLKKNKGKVSYVSVTAASNVTGYVTDVHKVAKIAHKYGAKIVVDGAQIVAHRKFSMLGETEDENIDFLAFSAHKMYSPYGGGAVVGLSEELNKHMPTFYGGGTITIVGDDWQHYKEAPARYEAGSPNYPGVVGLGKAIEVLNDVGFDDIQAHEKVLNRRLIDGLKKYDNVIIYGDSENIDDRVGVVTFNFTDINTKLLAEKLSEMGGVATRRGAFCAHPYVWRLMGIPDSALESFEGCADAKTPGMVRVSFGIYNTTEEVDKFLEILPKAMAAAKEEGEMIDVVPAY